MRVLCLHFQCRGDWGKESFCVMIAFIIILMLGRICMYI